MTFFNDFIAGKENFNRSLSQEEKTILAGFPNANVESITFLGSGAIRPSVETVKNTNACKAQLKSMT